MAVLRQPKFYKSIAAVIFLAALCSVVFVFRATIDAVISNVETQLFPCAQPIKYSIGTFDPRFKLSEETFLADVSTAEKIWEDVAGKQLFEYTRDGWLKINLIYDERQAATEKLAKLGIVIDNTKASYDALKAKYDTLQTDYKNIKASYDAAAAQYKTDLANYNAQVKSINRHGGATPEEAAQLEADRSALEAEFADLNALLTEVNIDADNLNAMATVLNQLAVTVNANVSTYNNLPTIGEAFTEGDYASNLLSSAIDIYQFDDNAKLVRVLAHELGHALGLEHVTDPKAIMYYLNEGVNEKPTTADSDELKIRCKL